MVVELPHPDGNRPTRKTPEHEKMTCPVCKVRLSMSVRQNVEIDYCPECRGVWLDRGELDKIIERSATEAAPAPARRAERRDDRRNDRHWDDDDDDHRDRHKRRQSEKSSVAYWLKEIFD